MVHQKTFYLHGGNVFSSLEKLSKELQTMSDEVFFHHVNASKHDFKEWVEHSLKKVDLAEKIQGKIDKMELELEILRHLVHDDKVKKKSAKKSTKKESTNKSVKESSKKNSKKKVKKETGKSKKNEKDERKK